MIEESKMEIKPKVKHLFDYEFDDSKVKSSTSLLFGKTNGLLNTNNLTYPWAFNLFELMESNTWFPKEIDFTEDKYSDCLPSEQRAYDLAHAQVNFMDGLQLTAVQDYLNGFITDPMVNACLARLAYEESNHSRSYSVAIEAVILGKKEYIYNLHKHDPILRKKNLHIGGIYEKYGPIGVDKTGKYSFQERFEAAVMMLIANQCLEGIYFMSNFAAMYCLGRSGKLNGTVRNFKFINRDEDCHTTLISNIFKEVYKEYRELFTQDLIDRIYGMLRDAVDLEIEWAIYLTNNEIFGIDNDSFTKYIRFLGNDRIRLLGLKDEYGWLYDDCHENNLTWIDQFKKLNDTKTDFFQSDVQNYTMGINTSDIDEDE